jgi:drug/metabolite transporter (DMT)-like permease
VRAPTKASAPRRERAELVGAALIGVAALQFGSVVVLGRIATRPGGLPVPALLAIRFAAAAALLALALIAVRQPLAAARGEGWRLALLGMGGYAVEAALFFTALRHGTAAAVTLLFFTYPVLVSVTVFLLGRGLPGWLLGGSLSSAVAGAAIVVVAAGGVDIEPLGVALALGSSLTFTMYLLGAEFVLKRTNSLAGAMWVSASAAVGLAAYAAATGSAEWPDGWRQWGPVLAMAAFTAGAFVCLFAGLRRIGAVRTAIVSASEPLTAAVLAAVFLGEGVGAGTIAGGLLIVAGAVTASLARASHPAGAQGP